MTLKNKQKRKKNSKTKEYVLSIIEHSNKTVCIKYKIILIF